MEHDVEKESMKKRLIVAAAAVGVVTVTVLAYYSASGSAEGPRLNTSAVTRGPVVETVSATGTLEAVETVEVGTQVSGTIKALNADYNDRVRKGRVIAQLEPSLFETQVEQARATVQRLQADVEARRVQLADTELKLRRARDLSAKQLIPASDLETAESNMRQAEAALKAAQAQLVQGLASLNQTQVNLGHTTIVAPIDGIVVSRNVDVGQTVAASMSAPTLFVLARDLTRMQVNAKIDEADIGRIKPGQLVEFSVDAYAGEKFSGKVRQVRLQPVVEQNVVSYVTVVDVPNPELKLKPGMTATVTVEIERAEDALRVPTGALRFRPTAEVLTALGPASADGFGAAGHEVPQERAPAATRAARAAAPAGAGRSGTDTSGNVTGRPGRSGRNNNPSDLRDLSGMGASARRGRAGVWVLRDGRLRRVRVETSTSDGVVTAVVGGELEEGDQVVTGLAAQAAATASPSSGSPLLPRRLGGNRGGQGGQGGGRPAGAGPR
jgi:HlyD family secretion protein